MDAFEAARQSFFSGSEIPSATVFKQSKSIDGMTAVPVIEPRAGSKAEEKVAVVR